VYFAQETLPSFKPQIGIGGLESLTPNQFYLTGPETIVGKINLGATLGTPDILALHSGKRRRGTIFFGWKIFS